MCHVHSQTHTHARAHGGTEEDGSHTGPMEWKKIQAGQCFVKMFYAFLAWYSASVWRLLVLVDVFSRLSKTKQTQKTNKNKKPGRALCLKSPSVGFSLSLCETNVESRKVFFHSTPANGIFPLHLLGIPANPITTRSESWFLTKYVTFNL